MQLAIDDKELKSPVERVVKELHLAPEEQLKGKTWDIDQFRKECCGNKASDWVRTFIFDEFPETDFKNGGWCIAPHKTPGIKSTIILAYEASLWMQEHFHDINWKGRTA